MTYLALHVFILGIAGEQLFEKRTEIEGSVSQVVVCILTFASNSITAGGGCVKQQCDDYVNFTNGGR